MNKIAPTFLLLVLIIATLGFTVLPQPTMMVVEVQDYMKTYSALFVPLLWVDE